MYFREHLEELLHDLVNLYSQLRSVIIIGDFNAHLNGKTFIRHIDRRRAALCELTNMLHLFNITTALICVGAEYSNVSYDKSSKSLIDHVIFSSDLINSVRYCNITDDNCFNVSCRI